MTEPARIFAAHGGGQFVGQASERAARQGRLESGHQPLLVVRAGGLLHQLGAREQVLAAASRDQRILALRPARRSTARTIGWLQKAAARETNRAPPSRSVSAFVSIAHQSRSGRCGSRESSCLSIRLATIAIDWSAGSLRAVQASWLRTSTSGSFASRRSARADAGDPRVTTSLRVAREAGTVQSRTYGSAWPSRSGKLDLSSRPAAQVQRLVEQLRAPTDRCCPGLRPPCRETAEASLRSPISRRAV